MSIKHRDYFNRISSDWDSMVCFGDDLEKSMADFIQGSDYVLDVGAGTGRLTAVLQEKVNRSGLVVAIDIAEQMLKQGKNRFCSSTLRISTDICHPGLKSGLFNKVVCYSTFPHIVDKKAALGEILRLLKPGGKLLVFHNKSSQELNELHGSFDDIVRHDTMPSAKTLKKWALQIGFVAILTIERPGFYWLEVMKPG